MVSPFCKDATEYQAGKSGNMVSGVGVSVGM